MTNNKGGARISGRSMAVIFLALCIVFSLLGLGGAKLGSLRADVMSLYEGGEGSILDDLTRHNENAYNIITVAKRVLGADHEAVTDAEAAYKAMNGAATPAARYAADQGLDAAITALVTTLNASNLPQKTASLVSSEKSAMDSRDMIISHSDYNARVTEYANVVSSFPANIIALARGLGAPEYYR